jgi:hypothetical protein
MSYHDLHITTPKMMRTSIFNLPYRIRVQCCRTGGWEVWAIAENHLPEELIGGEFGPPVRIDVAGHVIVDSMAVEKDN